ncbi:Na+/H+ antiporter NhaA [Pontibacter sp. MBLB2868]|uniref:Na+/H+ antiporter NhaA n=1 Tax=Pontibacter sp. MBLB2868 TaxID=3451555 RepID=UPI003F75504E
MAKYQLVRRIIYPLQEFVRAEAFSGIVLIFITLVALAWANSPWSESYAATWNTVLSFKLGDLEISKAALLWINDGLMAIFFLVVGLEIKREMLTGELSTFRRAAFPVMGALGGMLVPAGIYAYLNQGLEGFGGWGVPMATDIAFAIGILTLLGKRIPLTLKLFLVAYAIVDDIGAVLVIAVLYTSDLNMLSLSVGFLMFGILVMLSAVRVNSIWIYTILGLVMWVAFLKSGVHATVAGILLAVTIPARPKISEEDFVTSTDTILGELHAVHLNQLHKSDVPESGDELQAAVNTIEQNCEEVQSPLLRMEHGLHNWVAFAIMPVFALANAGIYIDAKLTDGFNNPVSWGIILGLVIGKPVGIILFTTLAHFTKLAEKPASYNWQQLLGASLLGGIGFTMAIFIANLAFAGTTLLPQAKLAILFASLIAGLSGYLLLRITRGVPQPD